MPTPNSTASRATASHATASHAAFESSLETLSLLARQTVFTKNEETTDDIIAPQNPNKGSTLLLADASVFHPMPEATRQTSQSPAPDPDGYDAGFAAGQAQSERVFKETIAMMENVLEGLKSDMGSMRDAIEVSHAKAVRESLCAVLPDLGHHALISEIERILKQSASGALKGRIEAKVHPDNTELKSFFENKHAADISVVPDTAQSLSGVAFVWSGGGIDIDPKSVVAACLDAVGGDTAMMTDAENRAPSMESDEL